MTADHAFIDSLGNTVNGREKMRFGWRGTNGKVLAENKWQTPTAWLAVVEGGLVKQWRV
jgi:hypothetical protein